MTPLLILTQEKFLLNGNQLLSTPVKGKIEPTQQSGNKHVSNKQPKGKTGRRNPSDT